MPLHSIMFAVPRTAKHDTDNTPAELPLGRVRFSDELGRETALVARREQLAASRSAAKQAKAQSDAAAHDSAEAAAAEPVVESTTDSAANAGDGDPAARAAGGDAEVALATPPAATTKGGATTPAPAASAKPKAARNVTVDAATTAASAAQGDDEIALALAQLGLVVPAEPEPTPAPTAALDPLAARIVTDGPRSAAAADGATKTTGEELGAMALVADRGDDGAAVRALVARFEKEGERDTATSVKVAAADARHGSAELARLLAAAGAVSDAGHGANFSVHDASAAPKAATGADPAAERVADAMPRVALAGLPHALPALLDGLASQMRMGRRGRNWEVELRLDPPELGSLHIRFELHGDAIRGVVHCEPRVERLLAPVLKELEDQLAQQGGGASFDLSRQAKEGEERSSAPRFTQPDRVPAAAAEPRASARRIDPSRLVDVTA